MKKFFHLIMSFVMMLGLLSFVSCGDDDDKGRSDNEVVNNETTGSVTSAKQLVGKWENDKITFTFNANGTGDAVLTASGVVVDFSYTVSNGFVKLDLVDGDPETYSAYFKNGSLCLEDTEGMGFVLSKAGSNGGNNGGGNNGGGTTTGSFEGVWVEKESDENNSYAGFYITNGVVYSGALNYDGIFYYYSEPDGKVSGGTIVLDEAGALRTTLSGDKLTISFGGENATFYKKNCKTKSVKDE